jgi:hypothetical protein
MHPERGPATAGGENLNPAQEWRIAKLFGLALMKSLGGLKPHSMGTFYGRPEGRRFQNGT